MLSKITMPGAGQTVDRLRIIKWHKREGDEVERGSVLASLETDKATLEIESFARGTLLKICVAEGEYADIGDVIAYIGEQGDLNGLKESETPAQADDYTPIMPSGNDNAASQSHETGIATNDSRSVVKISPAAKKAARDAGVSPEMIALMLKTDMVKKRDVLESMPHPGSESIPVSPMRRAIAARMLESVSSIPAFNIEIDANLSAMKSLREIMRSKGVDIAYHDILAKCASLSVKNHPLIGAQYSPNEIVLRRNIDIGIAVSLENGLLAPVIRNVADKSITEIAYEASVLIEKARSGNIIESEMGGASLTISNLGMFPIARFSALINPPESCILAVGGSKKTPYIKDGILLERETISITGTFDHRFIDGAYGAAFMTNLMEFIENPALMLF
ncbi:MAG: 2-oxo acid dehydrogenase subunit E2 [Synergistaceae bacterium]|jgi:pyruvate dehydrogenase E2 component (dihydrolipoamide acetyltransferase)|nr:2-oxo acid dehydrogenase subunit E2 [Synergistaceae bacterium]